MGSRGSRTEIGARLAWRAKWRRRIQKYKTLIVLLLLIVILVPSFLAFTPWFPQKIYNSIDKNKIDPITGKLRGKAIRDMYYLGMFYASTMREDEAIKCYKTIERWYYGYDMESWVSNAPLNEIDPLEFPDDHVKYVSYALFKHAESLRLHGHGQWAMIMYNYYLDDFSHREDSDPKMNMDAETNSR